MANYAHARSPTKTRCGPGISEVGKWLTRLKLCIQPARAAFKTAHMVNIDLRRVRREFASNPHRRDRREIDHIRKHGLYTPRDFDASPFFSIVKQTILAGFDYHKQDWEPPTLSAVDRAQPAE
jgi:hypothetical protein